MKVGEMVQVTIQKITDYGFFASAGEQQVLILLHEMSWGNIRNTHDFGSVGEELDVLLIGKTKEHHLGSIKQLYPEDNPWKDPSIYAVGSIFYGVVESNTDYGSFVTINRFARALVHLDDGGGDLKPGSDVQVEILECQVESCLISARLL